MKNPLVSVFIPAYNVEDFIVESINSILNQTYLELEIVVIDDASSDQTYSKLESLSKLDSRIKLYRNDKNLGLVLNRNKGLQLCSGKYIALMDSDDISVENRIQRFVDFLEANTEFDAVTGWMQTFDNNGSKDILRYRTDFEMIKITSLFFSPLAHAAAMFKSSVIKDLKYIEGVNFGEDYDLWLRFLQNYKVHVIEDVFYLYRSHETQSTDKSKLEFNKSQLLKVVDRIHNILGINLNVEWKKFHVNYLFMQETMISKEDFFKWNEYLEILYISSKKTNYIDSKKFIDFVFLNYWQSQYIRFLPSFSFAEILKVSKQKFNKTSLIHKAKNIILKL
jgi:glycosyltransferase involved in cell wall biosynthesis